MCYCFKDLVVCQIFFIPRTVYLQTRMKLDCRLTLSKNQIRITLSLQTTFPWTFVRCAAVHKTVIQGHGAGNKMRQLNCLCDLAEWIQVIKEVLPYYTETRWLTVLAHKHLPAHINSVIYTADLTAAISHILLQRCCGSGLKKITCERIICVILLAGLSLLARWQ